MVKDFGDDLKARARRKSLLAVSSGDVKAMYKKGRGRTPLCAVDGLGALRIVDGPVIPGRYA